MSASIATVRLVMVLLLWAGPARAQQIIENLRAPKNLLHQDVRIPAHLAVPIQKINGRVNINVLHKQPLQAPPRAATVAISGMPLPGTNGEEVVLRNSSKDRFSGKLVSCDPEKGLVWKHPSIRDPLVIKLADVGRISLKHDHPSPKARTHRGKVTLRGGGALTGDLLSMDKKELLLDTWYAGQLKLPRTLLTGLFPGTVGARVVYEGPAKGDDWVTGDRNAAMNKRMLKIDQPIPGNQPASTGRWVFQDNVFQSTGSNGLLARRFKLPDRLNFEFDLNWSGSPSFNIGVHLFGDKFDQYQSNAYSIRLDSNYCYVYRMTLNGGTRSLGGNVRSQLSAGKKNARVSILVDRTKKTFTVLVNGTQIGHWRESGNFVGKSDGVMFVARSTYRVAVSRIRLTEWDGRLPAAHAGGDGIKDFVRFVNEDHMSGRVAAIKDGKLILKTEFKKDPLGLDLSKVGYIRFAKKDGALASGPATFYLQRGGRIEGKLLAWRPEGVEVHLVGLGRNTLVPQSILAIKFK